MQIKTLKASFHLDPFMSRNTRAVAVLVKPLEYCYAQPHAIDGSWDPLSTTTSSSCVYLSVVLQG